MVGRDVQQDTNTIIQHPAGAFHRKAVRFRYTYYPPYHSKYNPIERVWGVLEQHWNGSLLDTLETVLHFAQTMTYNGVRPVVDLVATTYHTGVKLSQKAMAKLEERFERLPGLEKYFVRIAPLSS